MADLIQIRRDTYDNWWSTNPTLANGEVGIITHASGSGNAVALNPLQCKVGDGSTTWRNLATQAWAEPGLSGSINQRINQVSGSLHTEVSLMSGSLESLEDNIGHYTCNNQGNVVAKSVSAPNYTRITGGAFKVKFNYKHTATSGTVTLKVGNAAAANLYYDGAPVTNNNTWEAGETVDVYFDGQYYMANNVSGGGTFATGEKVNTVGIDDEPTAGSDNLVKSGGVSQFLVQNFVEGKGTTTSTTKITGLISGHQYRIYLKDYSWGEDIPVSEGFVLFGIDSVYNNTNTTLLRRYKSDVPQEYYDFVVPENSDYISIYARYNNGEKLIFNIVELNTFVKALRTQQEIDSTVDTGTYICIPSVGGYFNTSSVLNVYKSGTTVYQSQLSGNILRKRESIDNGVTWGAWEPVLFENTTSNRLFGQGSLSEDNIDSLLEPGVYQGNGVLFVVRTIPGTSNIIQWKIKEHGTVPGVYNTVRPELKYRVYNGSTWNNWDYAIARSIYSQNEIETATDTGVYIGYNTSNQAGFTVPFYMIVYNDGTTIYQRQVNPITIRIRKKLVSASNWGPWGSDIFSGTFNYEDINTVTETGIYRPNAVTPVYGFALLYVRKTNNNITQVRFSINTAGEFLISIRKSIDNGSTWGDWEDYLQPLIDRIEILNSANEISETFDISNADYSSNVIISSSTGLYKQATNGSYYLPLSSSCKEVTITANSQKDTYYSFLKTLENRVSGGTPGYADNTNSVYMISAGTSKTITIPTNTNYLYLLSTSGGVDALPVSIIGKYFTPKVDISILNEKIDNLISIENVDILGLTVNNASITTDGKWKPTQINIAGKSSVLPVSSNLFCINVTSENDNLDYVAFLSNVPKSYDEVSNVDYAPGETGRHNLPLGMSILSVPSGTNYIAISRETSTGGNITPTSLILNNYQFLNKTKEQSKQLIGVHGQVIDNDIIYLENMSNVIPVSDPLSAFASGESNVYHEPETGLVYFTCIEGFDHPYEAYDCISLYVFSLTNPNRVKRFQIAKASDKGVSRCYTPNLVYLSYKKVRVFYTFQNENGTDGAYLYYKDFNFATETFSTESKVIDSDSNILTASAIQQFTVNQGGVDTGKNYIYIQKITDVASDGYRYCTLNCGESINYNIVVARSNNNFESLEFITITPFKLRYDCAIGVLSDKLYFVFRVGGGEYVASSGTSLCTAEINDGTVINWSTPVKFAEGDSRPDCYTYKNKVYMMAGNYHSVQGRPMRVSSSVWEGTSDNPEDYKKVVVVSDTRGIQNPRVFRYGYGDYGILMQNSPARVDYPNRESTGQLQWQFKTAVCFVCSRIN